MTPDQSLAYDLQLLGSLLATSSYGGQNDHWAAADEVAHYTQFRRVPRRAQRVAPGLKRLERRGWVEHRQEEWGKLYRPVERIRKALA